VVKARGYTAFVADAEAPEQTEDESRAERDARRLYLLTTVRQYPDAVLRMRTREVTQFDQTLGELIERMTEVMERANGVGLAAPQLGSLQRVLVHRADEEAGPVALVNPRIVASSDERTTSEEGCLSLGAAEVTIEVERPTGVTIEAMTPEGKPLSFEAEGFEARVIQHEVDHLDGVLIIDRADPEQRRNALAKLRPEPVLGPLR
jgi:peptide deformylase